MSIAKVRARNEARRASCATVETCPMLDGGPTVRSSVRASVRLLLFEKHLGLTGAVAGLARCGRRARRVTSAHAGVGDRANAQPRGGRTR